MRIQELKTCPICKSNDLEFKPNHIHEDIWASTLSHEVYRVDDVVICHSCDTKFFYEDGYMVSEFIPYKPVSSKDTLDMATDYDVALMSKKTKE